MRLGSRGSLTGRVAVGVALGLAAACGSEGTKSLEDAPPPTRADYGLDQRPSNETCRAPARPPSTQAVTFERVYAGVTLDTPMMLAQRPGDGSAWFAALRDGRIVRFDARNDASSTAVVADLAALAGMPVQQDSEGGLLGMAFHPKFAQNGRLYVTWVTTGGISDFRSLVGVLTSQDGGATFSTYETILGPFDQPAGNHNGGGIAFGKDGFLYLGYGDGGSGDDAFGHGQETTSFFSKVLRVDVDAPSGGLKYGIPPSNPFANGGGEPATFAMGFRNPFRLSIDRATGELWVGDVGQNQWEEIDRVERGGNYGWPCFEGTHPYKTASCASLAGLAPPVAEHEHVPQNSRSITGGVVYRGKAIPSFVGTYVYGDYKRAELYALSQDPITGAVSTTVLNDQGPSEYWVDFAEDQDGEVYATSLAPGGIYKLVPTGAAPPSTFPSRLSATGCVDRADPKSPAAGLVPYGVRSPLWSDGADKDRWIALPDGATVEVDAEGDLQFPIGTVLLKRFRFGDRLVETRLFVRHDDGEWGGYSYEWSDDQRDATLLLGGKTKDIGGVTWTFPSRAECMQCHTKAAGRSLGLELGQLNGDHVYPSTNRIANQLATLEHIGLFAKPLAARPPELAAFPVPTDDGPLEGRARSYLHANCSFCHRPGGGGRETMDLRFASSLAATKACNGAPEAGDLGVAGAKLLAPGDPEHSLLVVRPKAEGRGRMPPLGTKRVDEAGTGLLDAWVRGLTGCP